MNANTPSIDSTLTNSRIKTIAKVSLAVVFLLFLAYLATAIPGIEYLTGVAGATLSAVVVALVGLAAALVIAYLAMVLPPFLNRVLSDPPASVIEHGGGALRWTLLLVAVIVAHIGVRPLMAAMLGGVVWIVDIAFLLASIAVLAIVAIRLYFLLDPTARYIADKVTNTASQS